MWVNKTLFQVLLNDNRAQQLEITDIRTFSRDMVARWDVTKAQSTKDAITIDWMRHRINALEKERAILLNKIAGVIIPVPEIVPTRPGTLSPDIPDFDSMPSFEDVGDFEARRLGISHKDDGSLTYTK